MTVEYELSGRPLAVLNALASRAEYLYYILKAMDDAGIDNADEILKKATYAAGMARAKQMGAVNNPCELWKQILSNEDIRQILKVEWICEDDNNVEINLHGCYMVWAWEKMGVPPEMIERLCKINNPVDYGQTEYFGYELDLDPGIGRGEGHCSLKIKTKKQT